jgi:hypothetical protein
LITSPFQNAQVVAISRKNVAHIPVDGFQNQMVGLRDLMLRYEVVINHTMIKEKEELKWKY